MQQNNQGGGKKPDFIVTEKRGDSYEIVGAAWKNQSSKGDTYLSVSMNNGAKFSMWKNTPKPKDTEQQGYNQSNYGQRDNQMKTLSNSVPPPPQSNKDIEW